MKVKATWLVELNCLCPNCKEYVDLLDYSDFWDGRKLNVAEHDTPRSKNIDVVCPDCGEEFNVDCNY